MNKDQIAISMAGGFVTSFLWAFLTSWYFDASYWDAVSYHLISVSIGLPVMQLTQEALMDGGWGNITGGIFLNLLLTVTGFLFTMWYFDTSAWGVLGYVGIIAAILAFLGLLAGLGVWLQARKQRMAVEV